MGKICLKRAPHHKGVEEWSLEYCYVHSYIIIAMKISALNAQNGHETLKSSEVFGFRLITFGELSKNGNIVGCNFIQAVHRKHFGQ